MKPIASPRQAFVAYLVFAFGIVCGLFSRSFYAVGAGPLFFLIVGSLLSPLIVVNVERIVIGLARRRAHRFEDGRHETPYRGRQ